MNINKDNLGNEVSSETTNRKSGKSNAKTEKRTSVRLTPENSEKLNAALQKGYCISDYINWLMSGAAVVNVNDSRTLMEHVCRMETLVEGMCERDIREALREELWRICQFLK